MLPADPCPTDSLLSLLEELRAVLIGGDLARCETIVTDLEQAVARLPDSSATSAGLARLRLAALRSQALLDPAARGIRAARARLSELRAAAEGLCTYDSSGQRRIVAPCGTKGPHRR